HSTGEEGGEVAELDEVEFDAVRLEVAEGRGPLVARPGAQRARRIGDRAVPESDEMAHDRAQATTVIEGDRRNAAEGAVREHERRLLREFGDLLIRGSRGAEDDAVDLLGEAA